MTAPLYFIEASFRSGRAFIETDRDQNSRDHVISLIRSGEVKPIKVLEVCEDEGTCRDVTDEIVSIARDLDADDFTTRSKARMSARWDHARDLRKNYVEA